MSPIRAAELEGAIVVSRPTKWGNPFTIDGAIESGFAADRDQAM